MANTRFFRVYWLRAGLKLLVLEVAFLALAWLLYQHESGWHRFRFSDVLFIISSIMLITASVGMMSRPFEIPNSPWGVTALPVQPSEEERHLQILANYYEQKKFGVSLAVMGLLTFLVAVGLSYGINY